MSIFFTEYKKGTVKKYDLGKNNNKGIILFFTESKKLEPKAKNLKCLPEPLDDAFRRHASLAKQTRLGENQQGMVWYGGEGVHFLF